MPASLLKTASSLASVLNYENREMRFSAFFLSEGGAEQLELTKV